MKSLENNCRFDGSLTGIRRGALQVLRGIGLSTAFGRSVARYLSARDSPRLIARVSGLSPSRESDSVILPSVGVRNFTDSSVGSGAREAMLVLTTGRRAGGEARREGDGASPHVSAWPKKDWAPLH